MWAARNTVLLLSAALTVLGQDNPFARRSFSLNGCDGTGLDKLLEGVTDLANDAINAIDAVIGGKIFGLNDGSAEWYTARNLALIFGSDWENVDNDDNRLRFVGEHESYIRNVRKRYQQLADALSGDERKEWWTPALDWIICKPQSKPFPFRKPTFAGDIFNNLPDDESRTLVSELEDWAPMVYLSDSPFYSTKLHNKGIAGRRQITMKSSTEDVCATTLNNEQTPPTAFRHTIERHPVQWLALCNKFWDYQETVQNPDEGTDIERFTTRDSVLLHELMHMRYRPRPQWVDGIDGVDPDPDGGCTDVYKRVGSMRSNDHFYGWRGIVGLASWDSGLAFQNADNYQYFAIASRYMPRRWDPPATD